MPSQPPSSAFPFSGASVCKAKSQSQTNGIQIRQEKYKDDRKQGKWLNLL